jgi:hypothetical protein
MIYTLVLHMLLQKMTGKTCPFLKTYYNTKFEDPDDIVAPTSESDKTT